MQTAYNVLLEYFWLTYLRPFITLLLGLIFAVLSLIILYAEIANVFDFQDNIIYNIITASETTDDHSFFIFNVNIPPPDH